MTPEKVFISLILLNLGYLKKVSDSELAMQNYHNIREDPADLKETGLLIYSHETVRYKRLKTLGNYDVRSVCI